MTSIKTILVTGGAGYIGSHFVKTLLSHGYKVVVVDNLVHGHRQAVLTPYFVQCDLADTDTLDTVFKTYVIDIVVHFAAFAYVGESVTNPSKYYANNVVNTLNLLDVMLQNKVTKIVFSSSCAVYGNPLYTPIDEKHACNPVSPYGRTKLMVEQIMADYQVAYGLTYIALRYFNAAGCDPEGKLGENHVPETHLVPLVLKAAKGEIPYISIFGTDYDTPDGTCIRDYIGITDLVEAHILAINTLFTNSTSYSLNIGTGIGISVREIITAAQKVTGRNIRIKEEGRRPGDPAKLYASNDMARIVLGWTPKCVDIEEIIRTAWLWEISS